MLNCFYIHKYAIIATMLAVNQVFMLLIKQFKWKSLCKMFKKDCNENKK